MEKQKKSPLLKLVFFCIITTIIIVEITMARYETTLAKETNSTVAVMANNVSLDILTPQDIYPGSEPVIVPIVLTNEENGNICGVSQTFTMSIERANEINIPFEFTLCKDESCSEVLTPDSNNKYFDSSFKFEAGKKEQKKYYVKMIWPEEYNDHSYSLEIDYFKVSIEAVQID